MSKRRRGGRTPKSTRARLTRRGVTLVVAAVAATMAAYATGIHELLFVACLLAILPLSALLLVRMKRLKLSTKRTFSPRIVAAGSSTQVSIEVRNLAPTWSARALWRDVFPWAPWTTPQLPLQSLAPRRVRASRYNSTVLEYDLITPFRGVFELGPLSLEYGDPFGLVVGAATAGDEQDLVVIPDAVTLPESGLSIAAGDGSARVIQRRATGNDDDLMTREYRMGDALRRVHWRASARHGELMVRQEEQRTYPEARIILDTRKSGYSDVVSDAMDFERESDSFEWAVRMVASLGVHLHRSGFLVHVLETGPRQIEPLGDATQWTGRDEDFLVSLASIRLTEPQFGQKNRIGDDAVEGSLGPAFAVVGHPDPETVTWLARQRRPYELAVAFVLVGSNRATDYIEDAFGIDPKPTQVAEYLAASGWLVIPVRRTDDPADAWLEVANVAVIARGAV